MNPLDQIPRESEVTIETDVAAETTVASFFAFNTVISIVVSSVDSDAKDVLQSVVEMCRKFERLFSRTLPHSDVSRINAARGEKVVVDPTTIELLQAALKYCECSCGMFDITIGAVCRLWNFHTSQMPNPDELARALSHVDFRKVRLAPDTCEVWIEDECAMIDLGGIAKGYIADRIEEVLISAGYEGFLINLGGNVLAHGYKPNGNVWRVGVQDPSEPNQIVESMELLDASAVTSGIYERCFVRGDTLYHHILHPRTGMPVATDVAGVTVICERSIDAEGFSTTLLALGRARGLEFASARPQIQNAYFACTDGRVLSLM